MKKLLVILGGASLFALVSCVNPAGGAGLSKDSYDVAVLVLDQAFLAGEMSKEDYTSALKALKLSIENEGGWMDLLKSVGPIVLSVVGSLTGVRLWRGGIHKRKGEAK
jgi:hypothetical protein